jgi:hypothetical protein
MLRFQAKEGIRLRLVFIVKPHRRVVANRDAWGGSGVMYEPPHRGGVWSAVLFTAYGR